MKHLNGHETHIPEESFKRTPQGLAFTVVCCDEHEHSVHIQNAHRFKDDTAALARLLLTHQREASESHDAHVVIEEFAKRFAASDDCRGCTPEEPK